MVIPIHTINTSVCTLWALSKLFFHKIMYAAHAHQHFHFDRKSTVLSYTFAVGMYNYYK